MPKTKKISRISNISPKIANLKFEKQILGTPQMKLSSSDKVVHWGVRNDYPYRLIDLYVNSVTHKACVDFAVNAIVGGGVEYDALGGVEIGSPNYYTSWDNFIKALAFDFALYGAFAFQVIMNKDRRTYSFFNQPFESVRFEAMDEDGVIPAAWVSSDWTAKQKFPPVRLPLFGFQDGETIDYGQPYLFVYVSPNPVSPYYPLPPYIAGLKSIQAECEYLTYDLKSITNGFVPAGSISLPPVGTEEEKQAILKNIQQMFTGSENANSLLVFFREDSDDNPVNFTPFSLNNGHVDLFEAANDRTISRICAAHKVTSRGLIGFPMDDSGFSDSGSLLEAAFNIYNITTGNASRLAILSAINSAFALNGIDLELQLKPLSYASVSEERNAIGYTAYDGEPVDEDDATERVDNTI